MKSNLQNYTLRILPLFSIYHNHTGAFVGLAAVDYAGYGTQAEFYQFEYQELGDALAADGSYSWEAGETRDK